MSEKMKTLVQASEILAKIDNGENVDYYNVIIEGDIDLRELHLPRDNNGKYLIASSIRIRYSEIKGRVTFHDVIFQSSVDYSRDLNCLQRDAYSRRGDSFIESERYSTVSFLNTKFYMEVSFSWSNFKEGVSFWSAEFMEPIYFFDTIFNKNVYFDDAKFEMSANFNGAQFQREAGFHGAEFGGDTYFNKSDFKGYVSFYKSQIKGPTLSFRDAKFSDPNSQESACRIAKNTLEKVGDREEAGYHFYREMEGKRKKKPWYIRYPEWFFIQFIFGYGVHPFRLGASWLGFVGIFALIYWLGHGIDATTSSITDAPQIVDYIWFSIATAVTPGYAGYKPTADFKLVAGLEAIVGTFMWAAFIATFSRKYMR